jgi:hypothetical protein
MAANNRTNTLEDEPRPEEPGMGSALVAVLVMLLATAVLAALIYLIMLPIQSLPRHHTSAQPTSLATLSPPVRVPLRS